MKRLIWSLPVFLVGCATYADLGQNHVARTIVTEERSLFGTNMGFAKLQHCEKDKDGELVNCHDMSAWTPMWSQGVGGQLVGGGLTGLGTGLGLAYGSFGSSSSAVSNAVSAPAKGGHH